jgi:hypothetical protein
VIPRKQPTGVEGRLTGRADMHSERGREREKEIANFLAVSWRETDNTRRQNEKGQFYIVSSPLISLSLSHTLPCTPCQQLLFNSESASTLTERAGFINLIYKRDGVPFRLHRAMLTHTERELRGKGEVDGDKTRKRVGRP